jgi:thiol-disulfide isomerase/thioredoxin
VPIARPSRTIAFSGVLGLVVVLGGVGACSTSSAGASNQQTRYVALSHAVLTTYAAGNRKLSPRISGTDLDGKPLDLAQFAGKVVVLNFWASWCEPCQVEAPLLQRFQPLLQRHDATVLGVTYLDASPDSLGFVRELHLSYPSLRDNSGKFAHAYGTNQLPESFVLNRAGEIVAVSRGEIEQPFMKKALAVAEAS